MVTHTVSVAPSVAPSGRATVPNGAGAASLLAAGIGAFALGGLVLLNEASLLTIPALYAPAGGLSGRTTVATLVWLGVWRVLHHRWKERTVGMRVTCGAALALTLAGLVATFPPVWRLL